MRVLAIGNSYSQDATRYLYGIARAGGVDVKVVNLYIGGCSLSRHYRNMLSELTEDELKEMKNFTSYLRWKREHPVDASET